MDSVLLIECLRDLSFALQEVVVNDSQDTKNCCYCYSLPELIYYSVKLKDTVKSVINFRFWGYSRFHSSSLRIMGKNQRLHHLNLLANARYFEVDGWSFYLLWHPYLSVGFQEESFIIIIIYFQMELMIQHYFLTPISCKNPLILSFL